MGPPTARQKVAVVAARPPRALDVGTDPSQVAVAPATPRRPDAGQVGLGTSAVPATGEAGAKGLRGGHPAEDVLKGRPRNTPRDQRRRQVGAAPFSDVDTVLGDIVPARGAGLPVASVVT